jgi:hypothetical protein
VGKGEFELMNNVTNQFVEATGGRIQKSCQGGVHNACTDEVLIGITVYSGNTPVKVSQRQFVLASTRGARYVPAPARQATRVVPSRDLLPTTVLQPDDDGDYASGTLVFLVPQGAGRFNLLWQGLHVATFVKTARGKLYETR